jgi:hypothetical protein
MKNRDEKNQTHAERSFSHFLSIYKGLDPAEIARRCNLPFDKNNFALRIMGLPYLVPFPGCALNRLDAGGFSREGAGLSGIFAPFWSKNQQVRQAPGGAQPPVYEQILFLRYLCEGRWTPALGKRLSYREAPWGETYFPNFEGRCIKRFIRLFGGNIEGFNKVMSENPALKAEKLEKCDAGYRFEFSSGFYMSFLLWVADDEFPAQAQILFDDNMCAAFTAEDLAVACEAALSSL